MGTSGFSEFKKVRVKDSLQLGGRTETNLGQLDKILVVEATVDFAELAASFGTTTPTSSYGSLPDISVSVTVTGAALGDHVLVSIDKDLQDLILVGSVTAADTVELQLLNPNSSAIDVASGTVQVVVQRFSVA